jgi:hypothetical protein
MRPKPYKAPYTILTSGTRSGLEGRVLLAIQDGYVPAGGVAVDPNGGALIQAMILRDKVGLVQPL